MATTSTPPRSSFFLGLPPSIRQRIYTYLLALHSDEAVTTINYTLSWNWLENPSNSTFAGHQQIDFCRCPRQHPRTFNRSTEYHIYTRYKCYGPEVQFKSAREDLWVLSAGYARSGQINFLRPATRWELDQRPYGNILSTCKTVYEEAVSILYRRRNFLFLSGPCPRGRYQAYATQTFLSRLTPLARSHVTTLSLIAQNYEEDGCVKDAGQAYANLATYLEQHLPSFKTLCLNLWDQQLKNTVGMLQSIFKKEGALICLALDPMDGRVIDCKDIQSFELAIERKSRNVRHEDCGAAEDVKQVLEDKYKIRRDRVADRKERENIRRPRKPIPNKPADTMWEEVQAEEDTVEYEREIVVPMHARLVARKEIGVQRASKVQKVLSKSQTKVKVKAREEAQEVEEEDEDDDDEWVDAALSPAATDGGKGGDDERWEVL